MLRIFAMCLGLGVACAVPAKASDPLRAALDICGSVKSRESAGNALTRAGWTSVAPQDFTDADTRALAARNLTYRTIGMAADAAHWPDQWHGALAVARDKTTDGTGYYREPEGFLLLRVNSAAHASLVICELVLTVNGAAHLFGAAMPTVGAPPVDRLRDADGNVRGPLDMVVMQPAQIAALLGEPFPYAALLRLYAEVPLEEL